MVHFGILMFSLFYLNVCGWYGVASNKCALNFLIMKNHEKIKSNNSEKSFLLFFYHEHFIVTIIYWYERKNKINFTLPCNANPLPFSNHRTLLGEVLYLHLFFDRHSQNKYWRLFIQWHTHTSWQWKRKRERSISLINLIKKRKERRRRKKNNVQY